MDSSKQIERTAAAWLARRDSETWTEADQAELDAWLGAATANRVAWLRLTAAWRQSERLKVLGAGGPPGRVPARGVWPLSPFFEQLVTAEESPASTEAVESPEAAELPESPAKSSPRRRGLRFAAVAASLALAAVLALGWWEFSKVEQGSYLTAVGKLRTVALPDGSQATLSSNSSIDMRMSRRERRIELQRGEVYFEVTREPDRPFVVQVGERRVVVVGTQFAVRSDADELRVLVTEGRVRLESESSPSRHPELLTAGMEAVASRAGVQVRSHPLDEVGEMLSWRGGFLSFRDTPLAEAAAEFNRYNRRQIVVVDDAIAAIPIGGNFRWSNTDAFVRLLEQGFGVRAERRGDEIVLRGE